LNHINKSNFMQHVYRCMYKTLSCRINV
jgi:hypothetical protein